MSIRIASCPVQETKFSDLTFIGGESVLARFFARPFKRFQAIEAAGGVVLLAATAIALIWVNSPWGDSYDAFWNMQVNLSVNGTEIFDNHSLTDFVNDALMAIFFFVVGIEIKREMVEGQLRNMKEAALPAFAALGGMIVPALLFFAINSGGPAERGWGIPIATDIAFAVGIVSLLGNRISRQLKVFLLTLAIVDDIGAIIVIALFYSSGINTGWLVATVALLVVVRGLRRLRVWWIPAYVLVGSLVWWTTFRSGLHATIAGVALGLLTPARPLQSEEDTRVVARWLRDKPEVFPVDVRYAAFHIRESVSVAERLQMVLHPISSFAIIPIFALANAGVRLNGSLISTALQSQVTWGIIVGLVVGKTIGVTTFCLIATKLGFAKRPTSMTLRNLVGLAMIAGIGFTVSLFVAGLAFTGGGHLGDAVASAEPAISIVEEADGETIGEAPSGAPGELAFAEAGRAHVALAAEEWADARAIENNAKIGILFASLIASTGGLLVLSGGRKRFDD